MTDTTQKPTTGTQYREMKQEQAKELEGSGETLARHSTLPFTDLGWPHIDQIIVVDSKGRLVLVKRDGKVSKVTVDLLEDILLPDLEGFTEDIPLQDKLDKTKTQIMAMFMSSVETTAIADIKASSAVRKMLKGIQRNAEDPEERVFAKILNRCLEATMQLRLSRMLPVLTKYAAYRFWTPDDSEPTLRWWTEYLGTKYNPGGFWEIVDRVIGEASPCYLNDKTLSTLSDEFYLVRGQQSIGSRGAYSTHDKLESIRETEATLSVIDPIACEAAAVSGQVAVIEEGMVTSVRHVFVSGFKSKIGEKVVIFDREGRAARGEIDETEMDEDNHIVASLKKPRIINGAPDGTPVDDEHLYAVKLPTKFMRKTTLTTTAWMGLTPEDRWVSSETSAISGRSVPAHIAIAGGDYE